MKQIFFLKSHIAARLKWNVSMESRLVSLLLQHVFDPTGWLGHVGCYDLTFGLVSEDGLVL